MSDVVRSSPFPGSYGDSAELGAVFVMPSIWCLVADIVVGRYPFPVERPALTLHLLAISISDIGSAPAPESYHPSAHTSDAVLLGSIRPSSSRARSWAAASVTAGRRLSPRRSTGRTAADKKPNEINGPIRVPQLSFAKSSAKTTDFSGRITG